MNAEIITAKNKYNYMPLIKKMILCHFGAAIMGIMISFSNNTYLNIFTALLSFAFYMYILYTSVWDIGAKDKLAIDGKRMAADKLVGLKAALFANIPSFILAALCIIGRALGAFASFDFGNTIAYWANILARFWNGMYIGIFVVLQPAAPSELEAVLYMFIYLAATVPALLMCYLAYNAGIKGFRIIPEKKKD